VGPRRREASPFGPLRMRASGGTVGDVSPTEIFASICGLIALEILHLKWIVWEHWDCRRCGTKHKDCGHLPAWAKLL
jgi:hypothetical protein